MQTFNVHYFQHIEGEDLGSCEEYLIQHYRAKITTTAFYALPPNTVLEFDALPEIEDVDLLIVMGGTMSANDEKVFPWLRTEIAWIKDYINAGKPIIGLCLGAQLIAKSLGATVKTNPEKERGWRDVYATSPKSSDCFAIPQTIRVLQWHSETFTLPEHAIHLAQNEVCQNQIFQYHKNVIGFQFHPEVTTTTLQMFFDSLHEDIAKYQGPFVEPIEKTLNVAPEQYHAGQTLLNRAIDYVITHKNIPVDPVMEKQSVMV